ncbi:hypothetical protein [Micromonospora sp. NPDC005367]|uniref:hypothetical protein n=1 Tax=Micromonospora sp. NPDC005367 TaxID=3155590 RepID=UPI0033BEF52D
MNTELDALKGALDRQREHVLGTFEAVSIDAGATTLADRQATICLRSRILKTSSSRV